MGAATTPYVSFRKIVIRFIRQNSTEPTRRPPQLRRRRTLHVFKHVSLPFVTSESSFAPAPASALYGSGTSPVVLPSLQPAKSFDASATGQTMTVYLGRSASTTRNMKRWVVPTLLALLLTLSVEATDHTTRKLTQSDGPGFYGKPLSATPDDLIGDPSGRAHLLVSCSRLRAHFSACKW